MHSVRAHAARGNIGETRAIEREMRICDSRELLTRFFPVCTIDGRRCVSRVPPQLEVGRYARIAALYRGVCNFSRSLFFSLRMGCFFLSLVQVGWVGES